MAEISHSKASEGGFRLTAYGNVYVNTYYMRVLYARVRI